jgi:hypothetical protein
LIHELSSAMTAKQFLHQLASITLAYGVLLAVPLLVDFVCDTHSELLIIAWCNIGVLVMRAKKIGFPMPDNSRVDLAGGLRVLWWSLFWPEYLRRRS